MAVADVEAREDRNPRAIVDAQEALDDLDRFGAPASVPEQDWPELQRKLKASAHFSKGRALLQQALALPAGEKRASLLKDSEASLLEAERLNSADLEITYLLGLARLASGELAEAATNFATAYGAGGALAPKALDNLRTIYQMLDPGSHGPFETFLQQAEDRGLTSRAIPGKASTNAPPPFRRSSAYSGSESCRGCHAGIYQQWSQTGMAKMFRPYSPQNVVGDFRS